ncbi:hypothetical protein ACTI_64910 [Actinoplanes sp. OR16]|uniref:hypothetical protein n=1 Tax=Actinoplanes sp. OR16 TaxID=946334 RepID=UPI000F6EAA8C|nr:hypothetical protein [Actinoplanes sp. OR16]BBH69806.1 hypothetical protein ACTI_64910 [Actinoplanes sp. OR16]
MTEPENRARTVGDRLMELAGVLAPTTVITALLFYFGAVYTDGRLAYYGIQLGLADLSTQDVVLYGTEAIFNPLAVLLIAILLALLGHAGVTWVLAGDGHRGRGLVAAGLLALVGLVLAARAVIGMTDAEVYLHERTALTPLALAVSPVLIAYAAWIAGRVVLGGPPGRIRRWYEDAPTVRLRRAAAAAGIVLTVAGLFWATNRVAFTLGLSRSYDEAVDAGSAYRVVLDMRDPLVDLPDGVTEERLPAAGEDAPRFRYRGLRLVLESGGRLFLVPERWTRNGRTLVVAYDGSVRLQLIPPPKNLAP